MVFTVDEFIAGWIGGMLGLVVGHPLDTIKVRQQNFGTNLLVSITTTTKYEGYRGFFKGMLFPLLTVGPSNAIFFGVYGNVMKYLEGTPHHTHNISPKDTAAIARVFTAGCIGGFAQVLFTCPVEVIKVVLQSRTEHVKGWKRPHYEAPYTGSFDALRGIWRDRGVKGLYKGCLSMMFRDVLPNGLYVLTYEMLLYSNFAACTTHMVVKQMLAGGTAGIMSWAPVIPTDFVKSRMQADNPAEPKYKGMMHCYRASYREGGFPLFFKGSTVTILRTFPVNAVVFLVYEWTLETLYQLRTRT